MKTIFIKGLFVCFLFVICGCTQNNGHIGPLFGTWKLAELTVDGEADPDYQGNVFWKFQATAVSMLRVMDHHESSSSYGTWKSTEEQLLLEFIYHDDSDPNGTWKYAPLPETHLTTGVSSLEIVRLTHKRMQLTYQAPDGTVYGYKLEKW